MGGNCSACEESRQVKQTECLIDTDAKIDITIANGLPMKPTSPKSSNDTDPAIPTTIPNDSTSSTSSVSTISALNSETDDDDDRSLSVSDKKDSELKMNDKSKIGITASYLISKTIYDHLMCANNKCPFMNEKENKSMVECILSNIYLYGDTTRQILLGETINDLYFMCNSRELHIIHLKHLEMYHGKKEKFAQNRMCKCALWQIYLHKFEKDSKLYDKQMFELLTYSDSCYKSKAHLMSSPKYLNNCDYILNAKYLVHILTNSRLLSDRLSCKIIHRPSNLIFALQIIGQFMYNNLNLDAQDFHFIDTPPINTNLEILVHERQQIQLYHQKTRMELAENVKSGTNMGHFKSSSLHSNKKQKSIKDMNMNNDKNITSLKMLIKTTTKIDISLPICKVKMDQHFTNKVDFSVNSMVLSLFAIKQIVADDIDVDGLTSDIYGHLQSKLECKCNAFDAIKDVEHRLLSTTYETILSWTDIEITHRHFWRTIKFGIEYYDKGWKIDPKLIKWHNDLYDEWINNDEWMRSYKNQRVMITQQFNYGYAHKLNQYQKMMKLFDDLGFHEKLKSALRKNSAFRKKWVDVLLQKDPEIVDVFKNHQYPTNAVFISFNR